jgi:hypothetical protein
MTRILIILLGLVMLIGCTSEKKFAIHKTEMQVATHHSGEPNLFISKEGEIYLSWVEYMNDSTDVLQFSQLENDSWTEPTEIARGDDWFVNWADFPSLISVDKNYMSAQWLQKSALGTYDYDVKIALSMDRGQTWNPAIIPHRDGVNAEHGFVSMLPTPEGKTFAVWLDGRNTKKDTNNAMTLRTAEIDKDGNITEEKELDNRVCDCCQTGATWTDRGPVVVYRDRSEDEIRDIALVRKDNEEWTEPKPLYEDNWKIAGCPVNGPSISSKGSKVAVAWFTMSEDIPKVYTAISNDYGASFNLPLRIDEESAIGRVDVEIIGDKVFVVWMENAEENAHIMMKTISSNDKISEAYQLGVNSQSRSSGFPRLSGSQENIVIAWTDATDSIKVVRTYKLEIDEQ